MLWQVLNLHRIQSIIYSHCIYDTPNIDFLRNFSSEIQEVNSLLVSAYVFINKLQVNNNTLIKELLIREEDSAQYKNLLRFIAIIRKTFTDFY